MRRRRSRPTEPSDFSRRRFSEEYTSTDADHGRIETRAARVCSTPEYLKGTRKWPHLKTFAQVTSKREEGGKTSHSERVCLLSKHLPAREIPAIIRGHRQIENSLHRSLDVIMNDDHHRARKDNAPVNFAAPGRIAPDIIRANTDKGSNRVKFKRAGWKDDFLRSLLNDF